MIWHQCRSRYRFVFLSYVVQCSNKNIEWNHFKSHGKTIRTLKNKKSESFGSMKLLCHLKMFNASKHYFPAFSPHLLIWSLFSKQFTSESLQPSVMLNPKISSLWVTKCLPISDLNGQPLVFILSLLTLHSLARRNILAFVTCQPPLYISLRAYVTPHTVPLTLQIHGPTPFQSGSCIKPNSH